MMRSGRLGVTYLGQGRSDVLVWAPYADSVELTVTDPERRQTRLTRDDSGYHFARDVELEAGTPYLLRLDESDEYPDPTSRFQPEGVHGPSQVVDPSFSWTDEQWVGLPLDDYIIYELHIGAFCEDATFGGLTEHLPYLKELGVTAVELMPVAQFPGTRNWGYDGVNLFAVQNSYGGPEGLKRLVNACHEAELAVVLDVVYNHLGPEGNYLHKFGPYFTDHYKTPWGLALNFDGPYSDHIRRFFIENALYWIQEFHIDALRLDAVHAITDFSAKPFLWELGDAVRAAAEQLGRRIYLIAESDLNDPRLIRHPEVWGFGLDAQWSDDFHHALHALLTAEQTGYYADFGRVQDMAKALSEGYVYTGEYSRFRRRKHGAPVHDIPANRFVVCAQNHDQVGNRALGERLNAICGFEALKVATAAVMLSPFIPLLFMGQEYGETAPFLYFVDHSDPELIRAVREGRKAEFAGFDWTHEPPDAADAAAFDESKLNHRLRHEGRHAAMAAFTRTLIALRNEHALCNALAKQEQRLETDEARNALLIRRTTVNGELLALFNFDRTEQPIAPRATECSWRLVLDSADERWGGPGSEAPGNWPGTGEVSLPPHSVLVFKQDDAA